MTVGAGVEPSRLYTIVYQEDEARQSRLNGNQSYREILLLTENPDHMTKGAKTSRLLYSKQQEHGISRQRFHAIMKLGTNQMISTMDSDIRGLRRTKPRRSEGMQNTATKLVIHFSNVGTFAFTLDSVFHVEHGWVCATQQFIATSIFGHDYICVQ